MMLKIRAWYTDGRVFEVTSRTQWNRLPDTGALAVTEYHDDWRVIFSGGDWYFLGYDGKVGYVASGEWGTWLAEPDEPNPKRGDGVDDAEFRRLMDEVWEARTWSPDGSS